MMLVRRITSSLLCTAALAVPALLPAQRIAGITVRAENALQVERADEVLELPWADLQRRIPGITRDRVRVVDAATGAEAATQPFDSNGDGTVDQLLVLASFWPGERKDLVVQAAAPASAPRQRVHARHDEHRDDVAWESDRIAFRIYGQGLWNAHEYEPLVSSGLDLWVKSVRDLVVEKWYGKGHDAYHVDTGEGADFYTVGPTLGAGGDAVWRDGKMYPAKNFKSYRILADGPIRTVFELRYDPWDAGGVQVTETRRFTLDAGQNLGRMESTFTTADGSDVSYVIGTVKREGIVGSTSRAGAWGWLATWGPVERKNGGHGQLGTGVLMPRERIAEVRELGDHFVLQSTARSGVPVMHYVGGGWTDSGDFRGVEDWWRHLDRLSQRLASPVRVTIAPDGR